MDALIPSSMLRELGLAFSSMRELEPVLQSVLKQVKDQLACEGGSIWLLDEAEVDIKCTHVVGPQAEKLAGAALRAKKFLSAYRTTTGRLTETDGTLQSKWMDGKALRAYYEVDVHSMIGIPLSARGKLLGEINVLNKLGERAFFSQADYRLLSDLARQVAVTIQNTQVYERYYRSSGRQRLLNQISRHLHQTLDIDELIPRIFIEVNKAINAEAQSIWLVDEGAGVIRCRFARGMSGEA